MTDQEINIAIAEACGWVAMPDGPDYLPPGSLKTQSVPSYTADLNAMHEAEKVLREMQTMTYIDRLGEIVSQGMGDGSYEEIWNMLHATARQRAEAFLRTLGKWKD